MVIIARIFSSLNLDLHKKQKSLKFKIFDQSAHYYLKKKKKKKNVAYLYTKSHSKPGALARKLTKKIVININASTSY